MSLFRSTNPRLWFAQRKHEDRKLREQLGRFRGREAELRKLTPKRERPELTIVQEDMHDHQE